MSDTDKLSGITGLVMSLRSIAIADKERGINADVLDQAIVHLTQYKRLVEAMRQQDSARDRAALMSRQYWQHSELVREVQSSGKIILEFLQP